MKDPSRKPPVTALLIGEYGDDRVLIRDIFHRQGWRLRKPAKGNCWRCATGWAAL